MEKLTFEQVREIHRTAGEQSPEIAQMPLEQFADYASTVNPDYDYSAGKGMTWLKSASTAVDRFLEPVGAPLGAVGKKIGSFFGPTAESVGEGVGKSLPRMGLETFAALGGKAIPVVGLAVSAAGYGSAFARGYTENGPLGGAIAAGTLGLTPGAFKFGGEAVGQAIKGVGLPTAGERVLEYLGGQAGVAGLQSAGQLVQGQDPFTKENAIATVAGTLPFAVFDAPTLAKGYKIVSGKPQQASVVDAVKGTPMPIKSLADWFRVQEAQRDVQAVGKAMDAVAVENQLAQNQVSTEKRVEANRPVTSATPVQVPPASSVVVPPKQPELITTPKNIVYESLGESWGYSNGKASQMLKKGTSGTTDLTIFVSKPVAKDLVGKVVGRTALELKEPIEGGGQYALKTLDDGGNPIDEHVFPASHTPAKDMVPVNVISGRTFLGKPVTKVHGLEEMVFRPSAMQFRELAGEGPFGWSITRYANVPEGQKVVNAQHLTGRLRNLFPQEWEILEPLGLKKFLEEKKAVSGKDVEEWVRQNAPKVEVKPLYAGDQGDIGKLKQEGANLQHELETQGVRIEDVDDYFGVEFSYQGRRVRPEDMQSPIAQQMQRFNELHQLTQGDEISESATARYSMVNPKPLDQMPGAVDLLVRIPQQPRTRQEYIDQFKRFGKSEEELSQIYDLFSKIKGQGNTTVKPPKYSSSHYPTEGKNLLAHVRGYMESLPNGKKVFRVFEVQSDWAKELRRVNEGIEQGAGGNELTQSESRGRANKLNDPLLKHYERLALKAAIDHALKNGADYIALDDAETAMITEGHDRALSWKGFDTREQANDASIHLKVPFQYIEEIKTGKFKGKFKLMGIAPKYFEQIKKENFGKVGPDQEEGMVHHYEASLPQAMQELTGQKGERVEFGEHQNAVGTDTLRQAGLGGKPRPDLIFKNPDGTPKTVSTARLYSLDKAKQLLAKQGGIPIISRKLTDEALAATLTKMESLGASVEQLDKVAKIAESLPTGMRDVDVAKEAAIRQMLGEVDPRLETPTEMSMVRGLATFYTKLFELRGFSPNDINKLTNLSAKIGAAMGQSKVVVGPTSDPNSFFMPLTKTPDGKLIGLSYAPTYREPSWELAHKLWEVGHEYAHGWFNDVKLNQGDARANRVLSHAYEVFKEYEPTELAEIVRGLHKAVFPVDEKGLPLGGSLQTQGADARTKMAGLATREIQYAQGEQGVKEAMMDVVGLLAMGVVSPSKNSQGIKTFRELIKFGDPRIADFTQQVFTDLGAAFHANESLVDAMVGPGQTQLANMFGLTKRNESFGFAMKTLSEVMQDKLDLDSAKNYLTTLTSNLEGSPFNNDLSYAQIAKTYQVAQRMAGEAGLPVKEDFKWFNDVVKDTYDRAMSAKKWAEASGQRLGLLDYLKPMTQLVEDYPVLRPVFNLARSFQNLATESAKELWAPFFEVGTGKLDEQFIKDLGSPDSPLNKPMTDILLHQNMEQRLVTAEEFQKYAGHLSEDQQKQLRRGLAATSEMNERAAMMRLNGYSQELRDRLAQILVRKQKDLPDMNLRPEQAEVIAGMLFDHVYNNAPASPVLSTLPTVLFSDLVDFAQTLKPKYEEVRKMLRGDDGQGKPWWSSEVRLGEYFVGWRESGQSGVRGFHTKKEAVEFIDGLKRKGLDYKAWDKKDRLEQFGGVAPDLVEKYAAADEIAYNKMLAMLPDLTAEEKQFMRELYTPGDGARRMVTPAAMQERNLQLGREELNMFAGIMHYADATALGLAKQFIKSKAGIALHTPEMRENPNLQNNARRYLNNIIDPGSKEFNTMKSLIFMNYLGFNISSWFIEPTQLAVAHVPFLVKSGAGIGEAYGLVTKAATKAAKFAFGDKAAEKDFAGDSELYSALLRAQKEGVVDQGFIQDILMHEDVNTVNARRLARGDNSLMNTVDLAQKPLYWLLKGARSFYSVPAHLTTRSSFISSFEFAKSRGMSTEQAYGFAKDSVSTTAYTGGKAARPLALGMLGKAQGVGGLLYALQSYTFNTVAYMARLGKESFAKSDLTPTEKKAAQKAFGLMMGTQIALGGAMGLPMVAGAIGIIEQVFPEAEIRKNLRETMAKLFTDDQEMGSLVADASLNGILNLGPVDFGSRFQLGNMFGIDARNGFEWSNLAGPGANLIHRWVQAAGDAQQGDVGAVLRKVAPAGLRGITDLATNNWQEKDKFGNLIYNPSPLQTLARVAGFRPKQLNQYYEQLSINTRSEKIAGEQLSRFHRELADLLVQGGPRAAEVVRQRLIQHQTELPTYDPREGARQVAELAQRRMLPSVPLQSGRRTTVSERALLQSSYTPTAEPSALQRLQLTKQFEQSLRIPGVGVVNRSELSKAQMVDQLRQQNPTLTYPQAKLMVEKMVRRSVPVQ